jgi:hypothetical protein
MRWLIYLSRAVARPLENIVERGKKKRGNPQHRHATNPRLGNVQAVLSDRRSWRFSPGPGCWKKGHRNVVRFSYF